MLPVFSARITRLTRVALSVLTTLAVLSTFSFASAQGVAKQTFPRLGGYHIGATPFPERYSDPDYHNSCVDFAIIGGEVASINDDARAIRALKSDIFLAKYTKLQSVPVRYLGYAEIKRDKVFAERGPNNSMLSTGGRVISMAGQDRDWPDNWTVNITNYVQPDASGDRFPQWAATGL